MSLKLDRDAPAIAICRSAPFRLDGLDGIQVLGADATLRGAPVAKLEDAARREIIESVRAGKHVELLVPARTYRQKDGHPNLNSLRFKTSKLGSIAKSFTRRPMLVDHAKRQSNVLGRITESELADAAHGWAEFAQTFHVVKPDGVISVLDGTIAEFSIGWRGKGSIICTAHGVDVLGEKSCYWREDCYPGKRVALDTGSVIAEYEFQDAEGVETSGVVGPAVAGTRIEEVRAMLAAELSIPSINIPKGNPMKLVLLAAALGLPALNEEDDARAAKIVDDALAAKEERDTIAKELADERAAHAETKKSRDALTVEGANTLIADAYSEGKLVRKRGDDGKPVPSKREERLRKIAATDGLEALKAELEELPVIVPINERVLTDDIPEPARASGAPAHLSASLAAAEKQLGLTSGALSEHAQNMNGRGRGTFSKIPTLTPDKEG